MSVDLHACHESNKLGSEELMRLGSVILAIWLIIGAIAAGQRGYYGSSVSCAHAGTVLVTIPCDKPQPGPAARRPSRWRRLGTVRA